ncbi:MULTISPECIES: methionine ABC transporter permease [Brevibacillus]|jgi:D-methionine transport system permease protein|uniref:ABC transporter permease n=1 Tax=Brevibacillus parabrevis TaxID=54914 RepID=A0A4Y3PVW9_BREPA|nr:MULTISPECIES: ABC transporter permease subunit [Brevibacillus]MBU8711093.1 ABC transporter permease subunit [Brevibacillus parabrevis]MDH6350239.1 D-methionine transport system permease protein [Brevibacillus sp. 1238]MDR4999677.1 ABC transporter permease subunit [Brevibacillus parabrevis]MED2253759.1 ABC transporter permease subunit [Brevibacillus parabrevis]NRQ53906.1 ABC transporter permease subunit [Brevibacillus sp. HD1.4A]
MNNDLIDLLWEGLLETLYMVFWSSLFALAMGVVLGVTLVVTDKGGILEAPKLNKVISTVINGVRSLPLIILIVLLLPLSRLIVGTTLGPTAAIVSLSIGAAPFLGRIIESALKEVSAGKIEAAKAVGATPFTIIFRVLIPEAMPALVRGITIGIIGITEFTAVAGAIGAGGLGSLAIRFGYQRFREDVLIATVLLIILLVQIIQWSGDLLVKSINKKRYKFE